VATIPTRHHCPHADRKSDQTGGLQVPTLEAAMTKVRKVSKRSGV
jgi:hypothetical protein